MSANEGPITIFDGHNDVLLRLDVPDSAFLERANGGHLDLPRARDGHFGGGFFAVFVPSPRAAISARERDAVRNLSDDDGLPGPDLPLAQRSALRLAARLFRLERESNGALRVARTIDELEEALRRGILAAVLHFEGAEAIDPELDALEVFYQAGLRSLGPVWSRANAFGHGVPFSFPGLPDSGPGLTRAGRDLVRACNRLGIMIDLSHLNERGFWDVAELSSAPLVATHSNAHAICPSPRNLIDRQLAAIRESDGMVGLNFHVGFLRPDGGREADTPLTLLVEHIDYLVERLGIDRVGFGSDFDGATMPAALGDAAGLPRLVAALRDRGYDEAALRKLGHENWLRVLRKTWLA